MTIARLRFDLPPDVQRMTSRGAVELAGSISSRELSAVEVLEAHIACIEALNPRLNAIVVPLFDQARTTAEEIDRRLDDGDSVGPLAGVPVTVKGCYDVAGTPSTVGVEGFDVIPERDAPLVTRLKEAGAILLGKTNIAQLMVYVETDNPVHGRSDSPWNPDRSPGGSSGGEAASVASGCSAMGLATDIGGSIRVPAHFCGIFGIKPTSFRLSRSSTVDRHFFPGEEAIVDQPGLMARRVEDLERGLAVLARPGPTSEDPSSPPVPLRPPREVDVSTLRIGYFTDDGIFPASPAIHRAVEEARRELERKGAVLHPFAPPDTEAAVRMFFAILTADGAAWARRLLRNGPVDRRLRQLVTFARMPAPIRKVASGAARLAGQPGLADFLMTGGPLSASEFWEEVARLKAYRSRFLATMEVGGVDAILCPPFPLPALTHGASSEIGLGGAYSLLYNVLGFPAGVAPVTRVRDGEETERQPSRELAFKRASEVEEGSRGLPIGVQVAAKPWREDVVLALLLALEEAFSTGTDHPGAVLRSSIG